MTKQDIKQLIVRVEKLEKAVFGNSAQRKKVKVAKGVGESDFSLNKKAFVKRYAAGKSGPKRFTLLLAYITKGEIGKNTQLNEVKKYWNKTSAKDLLGKFNAFYPNKAQEKGWVDSKEYGTYCLTREWRNALWK